MTSRYILDNLFKGDLVKDRTVVLITHHLHLAAPVAAYLVKLGENGSVVHAGPIEGPISTSSSTTDVFKMTETETDDTTTLGDETPEEVKVAAKLIKDEEKAEGRISRRALISFFSHFGGCSYWVIFFTLVFTGQGLAVFQTLWLGAWAEAYKTAPRPEDVSPIFWLGFYIVLVLAGLAAVGASAIIYYLGAMRASRYVHAKLVDFIFGGECYVCDKLLNILSIHAIPGLDSCWPHHQPLHQGHEDNRPGVLRERLCCCGYDRHPDHPFHRGRLVRPALLPPGHCKYSCNRAPP